MRSTAAFRLLAALAAILVGFCLVLFAAAPAGAALATLRQSDPGADQTVDRLPEVITLVFDESPSSVKITVTGPDGADAVSSPPNIRGVGVRQPVRPGAAGRYTVRYEMSPVTGAPAVGSFSFTVARAGAVPAPSGAVPPAGPPTPSVSSPPPGGVTLPATPAAGTPAGTDPAAGPAAPGTDTPPARTARDAADGASNTLVIVLVVLGVSVVVGVLLLVLRSRTRRDPA